MKDPGPTVYLESAITFENEVNEDSVTVFLVELAQHISAKEKIIVVELDTPGGSVGAGIAMAKAIERSPVPVVCVVDGMAASMGLYILQSCDVRVMTKRSLLMGHEPSARMAGQPQALQDLAELLLRLSRAMAYHITARTNISPDDYLSKIAGGRELWFNFDDAVALKFVDYATDSTQDVLAGARVINALP